MAAVTCLDMAHQWKLVDTRVSPKGPLRGCAEREKFCTVCGSSKVEVMSWRGEIISRRYYSAQTYIDNCRLLDPNVVNNRRKRYRELILAHMKPDGRKLCSDCKLPKDILDHSECKPARRRKAKGKK